MVEVVAGGGGGGDGGSHGVGRCTLTGHGIMTIGSSEMEFRIQCRPGMYMDELGDA